MSLKFLATFPKRDFNLSIENQCIEIKMMYEMTVFSKATRKNKVGVVKALLEAGANPNQQGGLKEIVPISNITLFIIVPIGIIIPIFIIVPIFIVLIS